MNKQEMNKQEFIKKILSDIRNENSNFKKYLEKGKRTLKELINSINEFQQIQANTLKQAIFLKSFNHLIELLTSKLFECTNIRTEILIQLLCNSTNKLENCIIILSYGMKIITHDEFVWINKLKKIRNDNSITHPFNLLEMELNDQIQNLIRKIEQVSEFESKTDEKDFDQETIDHIIKFIEIDSKNELNKNNNDVKKIIKKLNSQSEKIFLVFILEWILNSSSDKKEEKLKFWLKDISNNDENLNKLLDFMDSVTPIKALLICSLIISMDKFNFHNQLDLFVEKMDSYLWSWVNKTIFYDYSETRFLLESMIPKKLLENLWLKKNREKIWKFYKWLLVEDSQHKTITWSIYKYENLIFENESACSFIVPKLKERLDLVKKRLDFDCKIREIKAYFKKNGIDCE